MKKSNFKKLLQKLFVNNISWFLIYPFVKIANKLQASRLNYSNRKSIAENEHRAKQLFFTNKVLNGPFLGMHYNLETQNSNSYAKKLGSYEKELHATLNKFLKKQYHYVINIGSDDGYYIVGILMQLTNCIGLAFDISKAANKNCLQLAMQNHVANRLDVNKMFELEKIKDKKGKKLFIVDCEGCENEIFSTEWSDECKNDDFIIELHYDKCPLILEKIKKIFQQTHNIELINAVPDHQKVLTYQYPELEGLSYAQKHFILNERESFMQWVILISKLTES